MYTVVEHTLAYLWRLQLCGQKVSFCPVPIQLERKLILIIISHGDNFMKLDGIEVLGVTDAQMGV